MYYALLLDTVTGTVHTTVDTTKNVAASAVDKGASLVGAAKGILYLTYHRNKYFAFIKYIWDIYIFL